MCKFNVDKNIAFPKMQSFLHFRNSKKYHFTLRFRSFYRYAILQNCISVLFYLFLGVLGDFTGLCLDINQECIAYTNKFCGFVRFVGIICISLQKRDLSYGDMKKQSSLII